MLRIGPNQSQAQAPPQAPPDPSQADPTQPDPTQQGDPSQDPSMAGAMPVHKVPPMIAVYMPPEAGPFQCANCLFFDAPGSCSMVDGPIDPNGLCHIFTPAGGPPQTPDQPDSMQAPPPDDQSQAPPDEPDPSQQGQ